MSRLVLAAALVAPLFAACDADVAPEAAPSGHVRGPVLTLTDFDRDSVLDQVAGRQDMRDTDLRALAAMDRDALVEALRGASGLAVDLSRLDADPSELRVVARAARDARLPILVENAFDADEMARAFGIGVEAAFVVVDNGQRRVRILSDDVLTIGGGERDAELGLDGRRTPTREDARTLSGTWDAHLLATRAIGILEYDAAAAYSGTVDSAAWRVGYSGSSVMWFASYDLGNWGFSVVPAYYPFAQRDFIDLDLSVSLADGTNGKRYLQLQDAGSGVGIYSNSSMLRNGDNDRYFYNDEVTVRIDFGDTSGLEIEDYQPYSPNNSSTYTSTTGWTVSGDGGYGSATGGVSYSSSSSTTRTLSDFGVTNRTDPDGFEWKYAMKKYSSPDDLIETIHSGDRHCHTHSVPTLGRSTFRPEFDAVMSTTTADDGIAHFTYGTTFQASGARIRGCVKDGLGYVKNVRYSTFERWVTIDTDFAVDLGDGAIF